MTEEVFDKVSLNLIHSGKRTRWRPRLNLVTSTLFSRSRRSFKLISLNIWRSIWWTITKFGTQKPQKKLKTSIEPRDLWPHFQGHKGILKLFPLNIWRKIWWTLTKFGTQNRQDKAKTKLKPRDLDLIFNATKVIWGHLKRFPLYIWRTIWRSLTKFGT